MKYHKVYPTVWTDPTRRALSEDGRTAMLYLETGPHRVTEGLFRLPVAYAAVDLQWTPERTSAAVDELVAAGLVEVDAAADLVLLVDALRTDPPKGGPQTTGATRALGELPPSPLRARYLDLARAHAPALARALTETLGWAPEDPPPDPPREGPPDPPREGPPAVSGRSPSTARDPLGPSNSSSPSNSTCSEPSVDQQEPAPDPLDLARQAMRRMGYRPHGDDELSSEVGAIRTALAHGWDPGQLLELAGAAGAPSIQSPRSWWKNRITTRKPPPRSPRPVAAERGPAVAGFDPDEDQRRRPQPPEHDPAEYQHNPDRPPVADIPAAAAAKAALTPETTTP